MTAWLLHNWKRKTVALATAIVLWIFINHSIIETKTIPNVPIRIVNMPPDVTVEGLLPNGILKKRVRLTVSGTRSVIDELEPGDLEAVIDGSMIDHESWILRIGKKNLISLNPSIDLGNNITSVSHSDYVINRSKIVTARIPVIIERPYGEPPKGYELLDVWPVRLTQVVNGPSRAIQDLQREGIKISFDLSKISKEELDAIREKQGGRDDISFPVPDSWKRIEIPFRNRIVEELNDPDVEFLTLDFLHHNFLPVNRPIPIQVFYPLEYSEAINPSTYPLATGPKISKRNGIMLFTFPVHLRNVSRDFLDVIRNHLMISILAAPKSESRVLDWSFEIIDQKQLGQAYVARSVEGLPASVAENSGVMQQYEAMMARRFQKYLERTSFWVTQTQRLSIESVLEDNAIVVK